LGLNVLHISESDAAGGAGRAAYALHRRLPALGHRSRMLVGRKVTPDAETRPIKRSDAWRAADRAAGDALDRLGLQYAFYPSSFGVAQDPWFLESDVLQLHNLHGSYFSFSALPVLTRRRPTVWQLHDLWALTGHVAYPLDCERWRFGCGACPYLHEYPRLERDTTALLWRLKRGVYARSRLTLVATSTWTAGLVAQSPLLERFPLRTIPNGVDTDRFRPGPQREARVRLGLPAERRIVLFVASDLRERRKGLALLEAALRTLAGPPLLLLAGEGAAAPDVEARALGPLADEALADAYRAADVLAVPTVADVLTLTAPESLACGTPCVSFDRGGVTDVVREGETGLTAPLGDVAGLAAALDRVLADDELRSRLGARGREVAEAEFGIGLQARRYAELYEELAGEAA
jgi:glycosyltransferase involved in cell wall biosynthesis